jgi:hypothetical protein
MRSRIWLVLAILARATTGHAEDLLWDRDRSTCFGAKPDLGDWELPGAWLDNGPLLDPAHAGWAALDGGCGTTSLGVRVDRRPVIPADSVTSFSMPVRVRISSDWTIYARPASSGSNDLDNTSFAASRRIRALSPFHVLTTIDAAILAPTSTITAARAGGIGLGASVLARLLPVTVFHVTTSIDAQRSLQAGTFDGGATLLLGAEWSWFERAELVVDAGQRIARSDGYHLWASFGARAPIAPVGRSHAVWTELAVSRDLVAARDSTGVWFCLAVRGR